MIPLNQVSIEHFIWGGQFSSMDSPKLPKKPLLINFFRLHTHSFLSPITTGFIFSIKISMKQFLVLKFFWMVILLIFFLALQYWPSDVPSNAIYDVSFRYRNSYLSVSGGFISSISVSAENLKLLEMFWQIIPLIFFLASEFWYSENSKNCYYFWFISACKVIFDRNCGLHNFHQGRNRSVSAFQDY